GSVYQQLLASGVGEHRNHRAGPAQHPQTGQHAHQHIDPPYEWNRFSNPVPDGKDMTQIISSYPFVHGLWNVTNPVFKRNVLMKPSRMASLTFSCLLTKNQIAKLCSVINGVLESKHAACGYELSLQSERLSQTFNTKNSLSTIESQILQHIKCSITEDSHSFYSHTTKPIS
ncbi:hypothetical protein WA588_003396, partial [Blastocystis sp. NMH]